VRFRWSRTGAGQATWGLAAGSFAVASIVLVLGLLYFRRVEQFFADVI